MKVLGISPDVWISSATLLEDGKVIAAVAEERLSRQKMTAVFPSLSIDYCLGQIGLPLSSIDRIAVAWNPGVHIRSASGRHISAPKWRGDYLATFPAALLKHLENPEVTEIEQILTTSKGVVKMLFINHHLAHIASAFFLSPFQRAAVLTVDGRGENETATWSLCHGNNIEKIQSVYLPHSLGLLYSAITEYLGFHPHSDEWKVMALASYGGQKNKYYPRLRQLVHFLKDGRFELDLTYFSYYLFDKQSTMFTDKLSELLGPSRKPSDPFETQHYDIARALQDIFEETSSHMLHHLHRLTGESHLAIAGGAAMNSVYNGKICQQTPFKDVFIPSCPDDTGVSIGAALYVYHCMLGGHMRHKEVHNFWGPKYSNDEIEKTLQKYKIRSESSDNPAYIAAQLIKDGKLIGWFQGAMEFGQRALGHRSILADPRDAGVKDRVNAAVKYREGFRPFAPAVLEERAQEFFVFPENVRVPFMERVFPVRESKRELIPAVVHVDGSCRLQTVTRHPSPEFYDLIHYFSEMTGIPVVLNTSFNLNGEPIVCSPTDAIRTFYSCGLDALIIGRYVVYK